MKCKECNDEKNQIKAGKTKTGTQKYKCKICGKYSVLESKNRGYSEEIKKQAIKLYISPLAKLRKLFKIANTCDQRKT